MTATATPESPDQLAEQLGWEACNGCVIKQIAVGQMLEGETGMMGYRIEGRPWRSTKGWQEILELRYNSKHHGVSQNSASMYSIRGVVADIIEKPFDLVNPAGENLGHSEMSYLHAYLNQNMELNIRVVPIVVKLSDGEIVVIDASWDYDLKKAGLALTAENGKDFYKEVFYLGRIVDINFADSSQNMDQIRKNVERLRGSPFLDDEPIGRLYTFVKPQ